jgi:hypothetical protein
MQSGAQKRVCTREPSGSRASTQGDVASTRRPRSHDALDHMEDGLGGVPHATLAVSWTVPSRAPALLRGKAARCRVSVIGLTLALISMDGLADDSVGDVLLVLLGAAAFVIGVAGLRPGLLIKEGARWDAFPGPSCTDVSLVAKSIHMTRSNVSSHAPRAFSL